MEFHYNADKVKGNLRQSQCLVKYIFSYSIDLWLIYLLRLVRTVGVYILLIQFIVTEKLEIDRLQRSYLKWLGLLSCFKIYPYRVSKILFLYNSCSNVTSRYEFSNTKLIRIINYFKVKRIIFYLSQFIKPFLFCNNVLITLESNLRISQRFIISYIKQGYYTCYNTIKLVKLKVI